MANAIRAGQIEIGIGGGVESMSLFPMRYAKNGGIIEKLSAQVFANDLASKCLIGNGTVSDTIAEKYGVSRE